MFKLLNISAKNYKSLKNFELDFGPNKNVFVGKNDVGKTNILKAIATVFGDKKIKKSDFYNSTQKLEITLNILIHQKTYSLKIESKIKNNLVENNFIIPQEIKKYYQQTQIIYIPADRKYKPKDPKSGYHKLINLILENKETTQLKTNYFHKILELGQLENLSASKNTTLLISLLELYMRTIKHAKNEGFKIFLLDQPENFLHPHATKHIDNILSKIAELQNTQIFYATHSPDLVSNFKKGIYEISDINFVHRKNEETQVKKIKNNNGQYNKIMINLLFKNASIFFSDAVILVEGETEKIGVPNIFENWNWQSKNNPDGDKYNLDLKNINVIDVGGKGALADWYKFSCDIFGKNKVFAMIDKDADFESDELMIQRSIQRVHGKQNIHPNDFIQYNWLMLDGEFESYYKQNKVYKYLENVIKKRAEKYGKNFDPKKYKRDLDILSYRLEKVNKTRKISKAYAKLFGKYFSHYGKPTIAFNLSTYLSQNNGYKKGLIEKFEYIVETLEK